MRGKLLLVAVPVLALIAAVVLVPSGSSASLPTSASFHGQINQNGSDDVSTVIVNDVTGTACCNATVEAKSGGSGFTGNLTAIQVTFGSDSTGKVCITDFDTPVSLTGVLLPTAGSSSWTFSPRTGPVVQGGFCGTGSLVNGVTDTVNVVYTSDTMSL